jgi:uncharacterized protein (UPF0261 family)
MLMRTPSRWVRPKRQLPPGVVVPCQPTLADRVPDGDGWLHELKHAALFEAIEAVFRQSDAHRVLRFPHHINDPAFAEAIVAEVRTVMGQPDLQP